MHAFISRTAVAATLCLAGLAQAQVKVQDAWLRSTTEHQTATGAFMRITAMQDQRLVGVSTAAAGTTQVHEMKMTGDVMRMRPIAALELPAGKTVELKPGGLHIMLLDLKKPIAAGAHVALNLELEDKDGKRQTQQIELEARAPGSATPPAHGAQR